jgi:O-6-methylguanine DNA methyltransferase
MKIEDQLEGLAGPAPAGLSENVALGTGLADGYDLYDSPLGEVVITFNLEGVSSVDVADKGFADRFGERYGRRLVRAEAPSAWARRIAPALEAGTPGLLPVDLRSVTPFQQEVLEVAASIPRGEVRPYAWLAHQVRRPRAARAVGTTMASNPLPLIIPCHRVVRADGHLGSYSLGGPHNKWKLLEHEGTDPASLEELAARQVRVQGNRSTGIFCYPTCRAVRLSKPDNVVGFRSGSDARTAGFRACRLCRPTG